MRTIGWTGLAFVAAASLGAVTVSRADAQEPGPAGGEAMLPPLVAALVGAAEIPGPGDPGGVGVAGITLDPILRTLCYALHVVNVAPASAAHIHEGAVRVAGPVVVPLDAPTGGDASGCVQNLDPELVLRLQQNPAGFYVNVHNAAFPDGALRGQLGR
jgi:hypothetical protein